MSLLVADAAARAVEFVGLPEAQLNLAQAVVHLAMAPKSNAVAMGIWTAREDVRTGPGGEVPLHLRDAHYRGAKSLGHGAGYEYPHDDPRGWVPSSTCPTSSPIGATTDPPAARSREPPSARACSTDAERRTARPTSEAAP